MKNEKKELLLKDLCARLPYGVTVKVFYKDIEIIPEDSDDETDYESDDVDLSVEDHDTIMSFINGTFIWKIKPYLRPMSNMTKEERKIYESLAFVGEARYVNPTCCSSVIGFLNENHLDYNHWIEKGLAIEAPNGMYN